MREKTSFACSCLTCLCQSFFNCSSQRKGTRIIGVWFQRFRGTNHWKWYWRIDFLLSLQVLDIIIRPLPNVITKTEYRCGHVCPTYRPPFSSRTAVPIFTKFDINILSLKSATNTCTLISSCGVKVKVKLTFSVSWRMAWRHTGERRYSHTHS